MLFTRKKKEEIREVVLVKEEKKSLFIGTPEMLREVKYNITAAEAHGMFVKWRQPEKEIFVEALKMARATGETATIIVDYSAKGHSHMPKVSEHVFRNKNRGLKNEFWI